MSENTFYLTTPIYYVNARPHIGHAYSTIVADVLARRHRLLGEEVYFLTGTDEHGQKIERSAAAAGVPPQQFTDQVSKTFADLWARMGITHDQFIRTTDAKHKLGAQQLFRTLYERGDIYLSSYTGQYSIGEEMFVEGPPGTIGPDGRPTETVTEENFFFRLSKYQLPLIDLIESGKLVITPESSKNEVLSFLRGDVFNAVNKPESNPPGFVPQSSRVLDGPAITQYIGNGTLRESELGWPYVPGALKDLSISRSSFTWGIPVPDDIQQAVGAKEKHVIYVWLDALANYITALGYGSPNETLFNKFWPADIHLVGKEITRFHCVYWPAFLLAAGIETPKQVTANGWLLFDNSKMSKSKGNVVRTETILDAFGTLCPAPAGLSASAVATPDPTDVPQRLKPDSEGGGDGTAEAVPLRVEAHPAPSITEPTAHDRDLFAADVLRYYLLREIPFGQDGSFSFDSLIIRYNADLANGYGNLVSRTLKMIHQYFDGIISPELHLVGHNSFTASENAAIYAAVAFNPDQLNEADQLFSSLDFHLALAVIQSKIKWTDDILSIAKPWKERNTHEETLYIRTQILYQAAESIRIITALLYPILPYATARVWSQLGLGDIEQAAAEGKLKNLQWGGLKPGTKLGPLGPIFPRADKGLAQIMADNEEKLATDSSKKTQIPFGNDKQEGHENSALSPEPSSSAHPGAPPRTSSLPEPSGTLTVGGSSAYTTGPHPIPSHTDVPGSGIFAQPQPATNSEEPITPQISIDDFAKIELRVAEIKLAERIPKADKLLRLEVDLGPLGRRQILSGIAEFYTPEELLGRRIIVIANLAPRKMRGLESHGMLLAASDEDHGKPHLATCGPDIALGSRLK